MRVWSASVKARDHTDTLQPKGGPVHHPYMPPTRSPSSDIPSHTNRSSVVQAKTYPLQLGGYFWIMHLTIGLTLTYLTID